MDMQRDKQRIAQALRQLEEVWTPTPAMEEFFGDKSVLITGGGGSVGGALCRQLALCHPSRIVLLDIYENNAYLLVHELKQRHPGLSVALEIGSICDQRRIEEVMARWKPDILCHAAAHKHVPMMEEAPVEAIQNNVFGTYTVLQAASQAGTSHFLLISTDKAVQPTSIMGCTKRMAELITLCQAGETRCTAVRFGNVLNSAGSIIPLFRQQIALGGPVTVTGREMRRYFMSLGEAAQLVLTALCRAKGGDIFMLDMGEQLSIDLLARALIEQQGLTPDKDIEIRYLPPRPGEKLKEQLAGDGEAFETVGERLRRCAHPAKPRDAWELLDPLREMITLPPKQAAEQLRQLTSQWNC